MESLAEGSLVSLLSAFDSDSDSETGATEPSSGASHAPIASLFDSEMCDSTRQVGDLEIPHSPPREDRVRRVLTVSDFDPMNNVLDEATRYQFKNEIIFSKLEHFTDPINTTNTIEGFMFSAQFHESELIKIAEPSEQIVKFMCNFGEKTFPGYTEAVAEPRTSQRGRKKKVKVEKNRKKQGTGKNFNSQITCVTPYGDSKPVNGVFPPDTRVYQFKVFRTGKLQLPGVRNCLIDDVIQCSRNIAECLSRLLHPNDTNPANVTRLININPVMKNYKFVVRIPQGYIINQKRFLCVINREKANAAEWPEKFRQIRIADTGYTRQETKLFIRYHTPIYKNTEKRARVNIFMRGKVNILGASYSHMTSLICEHLHWLIDKYYREIIVSEGDVSFPLGEDNVSVLSREESELAAEEFRRYPQICFAQSDYACIGAALLGAII